MFLGTPEAALPSLRALVEDGWPVEVVVTRPDKRRRRNRPPEPSPVKAAAVDLGLDVTHRLEAVLETEADLGVVVAYGRIIPTEMLARLPMVNVHFSLLPRWRGAAPVERAILAGDDQTGVCVMQVVPELDAGPVYAQSTVPMGQSHLAELRDELAEEGAALLTQTLRVGLHDPVPQQGAVTYADKIEPDDLHLDWSRPADELLRVIRLDGAWTTLRGARLRVLEAAVDETGASDPPAPGVIVGLTVGTGDRPLCLERVQPAGRDPMSATDWVNGARLEAGERLGRPDEEEGGPRG